MNIGQQVTLLRPVAGAAAVPEVAFVVKKGSAVVTNKDGQQETQEYASVRVMTAGPGELPYLERVPAYADEDAARAEGAGRWSAYTIVASEDGTPTSIAQGDSPNAPSPVAPVVIPDPVFTDE